MARHLVLVGGGHAHLFVLEGLAAGRFPRNLRVTLVSPTRGHAYSGMLPGLVGGRYRPEEITLDLAGLARSAGAVLREATAVGLDPPARVVRLDDGGTIGYDLVSFATGSGVAGAHTPGVAGRALFLKPIDQAIALAAAVERLARPRAGRGPAIVVVGAGAAGAEIALNVRAVFRRAGVGARIRLVDAGTGVLADRAPAARRALEAALAGNEVDLSPGRAVVEVGPDAVTLEGGETLPGDLVVWAAGAGGPEIFREAGLAVDPAGFLLVDDSLRSVSDPAVFAAGDAATLASHPLTPKAGVFAVRAGPVLRDNLAAALATPPGRFRRFRPPRRHLVLLNTGDGRAVLSYGPIACSGRWVMLLKDRIDRRFMARFRPR